MSEKKGRYLRLEIAPVQGSIPSPIVAQGVPAEHHVPAGARTRHLLSGSMSLALLPSRSTNQVLFLLGSFSAVPAEGSEVVQLWWLWQGAEGMGWLLPACPTPRSLGSGH